MLVPTATHVAVLTDDFRSHRFLPTIVTVDAVTATTAEWLLEISGLTVGHDHPDIETQGRDLAAQVRAAAIAHHRLSPCRDQVACTGTCALAPLDGGFAACALSATLAGTGTVPVHAPPAEVDRAARTYVQALRAAASAVFHCRRHAHPTGECWFRVDGVDRCGDVLAVAHRLGS